MVLDALEKPHAFGEKGQEINTWEAPPGPSMILTGLEHTEHGIICVQH